MEQNEDRPIQSIPPVELDVYMSRFFVSVRQRDGREYEPVTLRSMFGSLERHLRRHQYPCSVVAGHEFSRTRIALKTKQKELKSQGLGNNPHTADAITTAEIDTLYEKGQLGTDTVHSTLNTMWFNNTLYFGMRAGGAEHRALMWGDVTLNYDNELKLEYIEMNERQTKTRTGENVNNKRDSGKPRMYAVPENDRCPVAAYKFYAAKRPVDFCAPDTPFYLATNTMDDRPINNQWFKKQPVGRHKINGLLKKMATHACLPGLDSKRLTNTSIRKHLCQTLLNSNVPDTQAIHVTGHKNPQSLNNYRTLSNQQKCTMSNILSLSTETNETLTNRPVLQSCSNNVNPKTCANIAAASCSTSNDRSFTPNNDSFHSIFYGSSISGGTFNINVQIQPHPSSPKRKFKRVRLDFSDSD